MIIKISLISQNKLIFELIGFTSQINICYKLMVIDRYFRHLIKHALRIRTKHAKAAR